MRKLYIISGYLLRGPVLAVLVVLAAVFTLYQQLPALNQSAEVLSLASVSATTLSELTNEERIRSNLPALEINPLLNRAAEEKARNMATRGYFAHYSPEGNAPWVWLDQSGYKYAAAGENLAVSFTRSESVVRAWMNSPLHRANIQRANFTQMGIGVARGNYNGRDSIFVAQFFARPAVAVPSSVDLVPVSQSVPTVYNTFSSAAFAGRIVLIPLAVAIILALAIVLAFGKTRFRLRLALNGAVALALVAGLIWFNNYLEQVSPLVSYLEKV